MTKWIVLSVACLALSLGGEVLAEDLDSVGLWSPAFGNGYSFTDDNMVGMYFGNMGNPNFPSLGGRVIRVSTKLNPAGTGDNTAKVVVYRHDDFSFSPMIYVGQSDELTIAATDATAYYTFTFSDEVCVDSGTGNYYVAVWSDDTGATLRSHRDFTTDYYGPTSAQTYASSPPDGISLSGGNTAELTLYVVYDIDLGCAPSGSKKKRQQIMQEMSK